MSLKLQLIDNFFSKKEYDILINNLNKIPYEPASNANGLYGMNHNFEETKENKWLFDKIKNTFLPSFPEIKELGVVAASFQMRDNKGDMSPHTDKGIVGEYTLKYNCLIYLKGEEITYNGTGFYHDTNLNTYIGFVNNRALFFNGSDVYHSCLQGLGDSSARYTLGVFYGKKV
tara:strand:+ start:2432 stop:2950 length:519 start_codon:yes stop_codon:yes gene_type:complete